jgi:hypothetical protein
LRARIDQIANGFGLKNIQLAIEHCSPCEFPWERLPRPRRDQHGDYGAWNQVSAVCRELDRILASEGVRARKQSYERLIKYLIPIMYAAELCDARLRWRGV